MVSRMTSKQIKIVTFGIMLSLFMAAIEGTVIATAMPTIIAELGGLKHYSWVFSAYMLTATTMVPLYGKLSDVYGRRPIYFISMAFFLIGSMLSGLSATMGQLIAFRALQGVGAGGLMPLAFIMIGDMFSFEQRARMQGLFSGVWGVASIIGPLLGGFLVDQISWHWVFFVNVAPGLLAALLVGSAWRERIHKPAGAGRPAIDYAGTILLTAAVVALLLSLFQFGTLRGVLLFIAAVILFVALLFVERRAEDPVLPLALYRQRLFAVTTAQGLFASWAMFGSTNFVPLFGQAVLGVSAILVVIVRSRRGGRLGRLQGIDLDIRLGQGLVGLLQLGLIGGNDGVTRGRGGQRRDGLTAIGAGDDGCRLVAGRGRQRIA